MTADQWAAQRTPGQDAARQALLASEPAGWPNLACRRHPTFPLVLSIVEGMPWCALCLKFLKPEDYTVEAPK